MIVKFLKHIDIRGGVMLATWPGMGNVAIEAIDYMRRKLDTEIFAQIDISKLIVPDRIIVEEGIARMPPPLKNYFYYRKNPDFIFFKSETQLQGHEGVELMQAILDLACCYNVKRIYTAAAFPIPMTDRESSTVYGVANSKPLRDILYRYGIKIMESGQISGLNGLLLGYAKERGIDAICLLATMPIYAVNFIYPKASKALVEIFERLLDVRIDTTELDLVIAETSKKMRIVEEKLREIYVHDNYLKKEEERVDMVEKVPNYILEKIERLFQEVKQDKTKASILKEELDKWDLYKIYEDRFLDLFKKENH